MVELREAVVSVSMQDVVETIPGSSALEAFCREDGQQREFTSELRSILEVIAATGKYWHDWLQLRSLLCFRLTQVLQEYHNSQMQIEDNTADLVHGERFPDLLDRLVQGLESFTSGAPFTSQRLCELLLNPKDTYVQLDKLSLAFEKLLLVTSTAPASRDPYPSAVQSPTKNVESVEKVQTAGEVPSAVLTVNGVHEGNGPHKEIHDDEMIDVDTRVEQAASGESNEEPVVEEIVPQQSEPTAVTNPEKPSNGHVSPPAADVVVEDNPPADTNP